LQDVRLISKQYLSFKKFQQNSAWKNTECKEELFLLAEGQSTIQQAQLAVSQEIT
jgi:hypothetical protein